MIEHIGPPEKLTKAAAAFFTDYARVFLLLFSLTTLDKLIDKNFDTLYDKIGEIDTFFTGRRDSFKASAKNILSSTSYESILAQMIFCRFAESYLTYLTDLLALMFQARPELLRSGETERLDFILQYSNMEDLIRALAEKRVDRVSFKGLPDLITYFENKGLALFESPVEMSRANEITEIRNIIVHNHGIVSRIFKSRLPNYPAALDEPIKISMQEAGAAMGFTIKSVSNIDARAAEKFNLEQQDSQEIARSIMAPLFKPMRDELKIREEELGRRTEKLERLKAELEEYKQKYEIAKHREAELEESIQRYKNQSME